MNRLLPIAFYSIYFFIISSISSISFPQIVKSQYITNRFEHIFVKDGLPDNNVFWFLKDHLGFLWIGTGNGLVRYDGYNFVTYKHNPNDTSSISNNFITSVYEDKEGVLWIGTWYGLEKFNRVTETFVHYTLDTSGNENEASNQICPIHEDKYGKLWVGGGYGLYKFDRATEKFTVYRFDSTDPGSISHNVIEGVFEDKKGSLWFGGGGGLNKFNFETGKFEHYWNDPANRKKVWSNDSKYWSNVICGDSTGPIWLGTHLGLVEFNPETGDFSHYIPAPGIKQINKNNNIISICTDLSGVLWVGTMNGLYAFDIKSKKFISYYQHDYTEPGSLSNNNIIKVYFDQSGILWVGTQGGGVSKLSLKKNSIKSYNLDTRVKSFIEDKGMLFVNTENGWVKFNPSSEKFDSSPFGKNNVVWKENSGDLWFEDKEGGVYKKDDGGNIKYLYDVSGKIFNKSITYVYETKKGFWIGTNGYGLHFLDRATLKIKKFYKIKLSVSLIYEDSFGLIWFQSMYGKLVCLNQKQSTITEFMPDPKDSGSIIGRQVRYIYEDKKNKLWFATNQGLDKYNRTTKKFNHYLINNGIAGILEDDDGFLWLATNKGVLKFDPERNLFKSFDVSDWISIRYEGNKTSFKAANGEMYFASSKGFIRFHPDSIKINQFIPPVVITSFKIFNKEAILDTTISIKRIINLPYSENNISFEFASLDYTSPAKNQYAYKLEGFDKDWTYCGTRRNVSYTNLDYGSYLFRVKGSNSEGVWNETGASISIIITPPWWRTWWAYSSYILIFSFSLYVIRRYEMNRLRLKDKVKMDEAVLKEREEMDKMKSNFFANISHEFRTPLTLILGPIKQISERLKDNKTKNELNIAYNNAGKLLRLVNQLLDLSKVESGNMKLQAVPQNIVSVIKVLIISFSPYAERKKIKLKFDSTEEEIIAYIDKEKIEKIVTNILSNAFKFTPEGGIIELKLSNNLEYVNISIRDTGIGIPKEKISKIFDRFYQVDETNKKEYEGTGIGLALSKELIELHKGKIKIESTEGEGSIFTISIPLSKKLYTEEEICNSVKSNKVDTDLIPESRFFEATKKEKIDANMIIETEQPILLLVEDNSDVRSYIRENLEKEYTVLEAVNGEDGLKKSIEHIPDLIISDIMMPKMDGFQLCKKLKTDERTSHIPVILLTAKAAIQDKIEGFETGADEYIMKPFEPDELKARIKNLIEQRKRIHEHFKKHGLIELEESKITSADKKFLKKVFDTVTKNMSNPSFNVETLSELIAVSRSVLHKKVVSLIGEPPVELIRRIRVTRGAELIEKKYGNISEIALEVGFNNPAHFSEYFKMQFGVTPSQYLKKI